MTSCENQQYFIYVTSLYKFLPIEASTNQILFLYYFKYCYRLFYSHFAFLAPDED